MYITATAYSRGDPWKLAQPFDLDGNPCGSSGFSTAEYPYAYFFNPTKGLEYVICLKNCPFWDLTSNTPVNTLGECFLGYNASIETGMNRQGEQSCNSPTMYLDINDYAVINDITLGDSKNMKIYRTQKFMGRFCVPQAMNDASQFFYQKVMKNTDSDNKMDEYFSDLRNSWGIILISFGFAFVLSLFYLIILRWCTGFFVWTTILAFLGIILALAILFHKKSNNLEESASNLQGTTT